MTDKTIDDELKDLVADAEDTSYHTILEIWRAVLAPAQTERLKPITPQWAGRICGAYREINYADMPAYRDLYFDRVLEFARVLDLQIAEDDECLNRESAEEDAEHNATHYRQLILNWQQVLLDWELDWDCTAPTAAIELAAISEVHKMFFSEQGLTSLLDNIPFQFTDDDRDMLSAALTEYRASREG